MTIKRFKELIGQTHQHGLKLKAEIAALKKKNTPGARTKAAALSVYLRGLEVLNARRYKELARLEKEQPKPDPKPAPPAPKPAPKPTPKPKPKPAPQPPAPKPQRFTMYDSTNPSNIPHNPEAVAGYVDGAFANFDQMVKAFPKAKHLSIAVSSNVDAGALDVETGDATPTDAPAWVRKQHARGVKRPIIYANRSTMPAVITALTNDDIKRDEYLLWVAEYAGIGPHIRDGFDACQWQDHDELYDESLCEFYFL